MKKFAVIVAAGLSAGCASQGFMGDQPQIRPTKPATDVIVEMEGSDTICVTENNVRTCVPRVDETDSGESS